MQIEKLKAGQALYAVSRQPMGNTTMKTTAIHLVRVTNVAEDRKSFTASWNGNPSRDYRSVPPNWKAKKPVIVKNHLTARLATRDEKKTGTLTEGHCYFTLERKAEV